MIVLMTILEVLVIVTLEMKVHVRQREVARAIVEILFILAAVIIVILKLVVVATRVPEIVLVVEVLAVVTQTNHAYVIQIPVAVVIRMTRVGVRLINPDVFAIIVIVNKLVIATPEIMKDAAHVIVI